jgi:hypothetical protein
MNTDLLHQYGPWMLVIGGIVGLLSSTIFYSIQQRWVERLLIFGQEWIQAHSEAEWFQARFARMQRLLQHSVMRWLGLIQSIFLIAGGAIWFVLRP